MNEHPIEGLMNTAMNNLKDMIDVDTIVGDAIECGNNTTIIPISKVSFGFAAGGSEFNSETLEQYSKEGVDEDISYKLPFGGGSGAGVNITPIGFLVVAEAGVKMLPVNHCSAIDKLLDYVPDVVNKLMEMCKKEKTYRYEIYEDIGNDCTCGCHEGEECTCNKNVEAETENDTKE